MRGVRFWGIKCWIDVARGHFDTSKEELKSAFTVESKSYQLYVEHLKYF